MEKQYTLNTHVIIKEGLDGFSEPRITLDIKGSENIAHILSMENPGQAGESALSTFSVGTYNITGSLEEIFLKGVKNLAMPILALKLGKDFNYNDNILKENLKKLYQLLN